MKVLKAEVVNVVRANTRYGEKLCLNTKLLPSKEKAASWCNDLNNPIYLSKKPGDIIELIKDAKGKFSLLDREEHPETIVMGRPASSGGIYSHNAQEVTIEDGLDLPQPMSDQDKVRLNRLLKERAKLLAHTIEVMRDELNNKGLEFHEGSIRSLGVSLFIHISRHLD